jgi:hypothetical protein
MPVAETIDLVQRARTELAVPLGAVIVNRVLPELFTRDDEATFAALAGAELRPQLESVAGPGVGHVFDAARLAVAMRRSRVDRLLDLRATVDLPMLLVPYLFARSQGRRETGLVADALRAELGL